MSIKVDHLVRTRRKTIALVVERDGKLTVRAPLRLSEARIREFVEAHANWIARNQKRVKQVAVAPKEYKDGEKFLFLGQAFPLVIVPRQKTYLTFDGTNFRLAKSAIPRAQEAFVRWYKVQAYQEIQARLQVLSTRYKLDYEKLRISSARTRWGSCSTKGTLSFTWRLIMAPPQVVEYVIIHELVHTKVKNHSKEFWGGVEKIMPGYKTCVRWLKKNGSYLTF
jgi:hypothetical protein